MKSTAFAAVGLLLLAALPVAAQPQTRVVKVPGTNPPVEIVFVNCPGGKVKPGDPTATATEVPVGPFAIAQTEFTVGQLRGLLGDAAVERIKAQVKIYQPELLNDDYYKEVFLPKKGDSFPLFCLPIDEVVAICKELNKRTIGDPERIKRAATDPLPEIEADDFRVPTYHQWQYACRGPNPLEKPHFGTWPALDAFKDKANLLKQRWKEMGFQDEFTGTQEQLLRISRLSKTHNKRGDADKFLLEYWTTMLQPPEGKARLVDDGLGELIPVGKTQANVWGLFDMHDNVSEWVLWADSTKTYNQYWQDLLFRGAASVRAEPRMFLCGGHFNDTFYGVNSLHKFTSWGGPVLGGTNDRVEPLRYLDDKGDNDLLRQNPGLRLVIVRGLAEDWFAMFRKAWLPDGKTPVDEAKQAAIVVRVNRVFDEQALATDHPARDILAFYKALNTDQTATVTEMKKVQSKMGTAKTADDDKAYLDLLSGLVEGDKKKP